MPKQRCNPLWAEQTVPKTPLQRGLFIDACIKWLVHERNHDEHEEPFECTCVGQTDVEPQRTFVYTRSELNAFVGDACSLCQKPSSVLVMANPYSQRCFLRVCDECEAPDAASTRKGR